MVLEMRDQDLVVCAELRATETLCDEINGLRGAAREYDFAAARRVYEFPELITRALVRIGGAMAESVDSAMHVGVIVSLVCRDRVDNDCGLLCRGGAVEVRDRMIIDLLLERRKFAPVLGDGCRCLLVLLRLRHLESPLLSPVRRASTISVNDSTSSAIDKRPTMLAPKARVSARIASCLSRPRERR